MIIDLRKLNRIKNIDKVRKLKLMTNMNQHQLKDEINKTYREAHEYQSDANTEKDPVRKEFLERKVKELHIKYELLKGEKLVLQT